MFQLVKHSYELNYLYFFDSIEYIEAMNITLNRAFCSRGLTAKSASTISGIRYVTIYQHLTGKRSISAEMTLKYETLLGIPRSELRPDLWPPDESQAASDKQEA